MGEELNDLRAADGAGKQAEVKVPPGDARHGRQRLPVEVVLQHRSLSPRRPGAAAVGPLAQSALVDENDRPSFFLGFFLISGQRFRFHSWIFSSLRSRARPVGCTKTRWCFPVFPSVPVFQHSSVEELHTAEYFSITLTNHNPVVLLRVIGRQFEHPALFPLRVSGRDGGSIPPSECSQQQRAVVSDSEICNRTSQAAR